jgi:hypothetical protein
MTTADDDRSADDDTSHFGELALRRFRAGEFAAAEADAIGAHTARCGRCRARLGAIDDEQREFERAIPFERFAGGVERAARVPGPQRARSKLRSPWLVPALSLAAAAAFMLVVRTRPHDVPEEIGGFNHRKGAAADAQLRIAAADGKAQRTLASSGTAKLRLGERLRIGYETDRARHLIALSIDDQNVVTALYPDTGTTLAGASVLVKASTGVAYLPDSFELTGAGHERVFLLMADGPFSVESAVTAVRASRTAAGPAKLPGMTSETAMRALDALAPRSFTWLLEKP